MRSKLTKTIILIVFVVFLGINDVSAAETCTFYRDSSREYSEYYILQLDNSGKLVKATYQRKILRDGRVYSEDRTSSVRISFHTCRGIKNYNFEGATYTQLYDNSNTNSHSSSNSNSNSQSNTNSSSNIVGSLDPGEDLNTVSCGEITGIPKGIPATTRVIYLFLQIGIPIILVVFGMMDMMKSITGQKEDEIKKGQQTLIKRLVSAALVFFVFAIVKMVASYLADNTSVGKCLNCFIKGSCEASESQNPGGSGGGRLNQSQSAY